MNGRWMSTTLGELAAAMGVSAPSTPDNQPGDWFCVAHELVLWPNGRLFSEKPVGGDGRRVLLGNRNGPNATMYARSATVPVGVRHLRHGHGSNTCKLDLDGWVLFARRVVVLSEYLDQATFSCSEPGGSALWAHLKKARRL